MTVEFRKAKISDAAEIHQLILAYATAGLMLARSRQSIYAHIREYVVGVASDGQVVATGALGILWQDLAEIRSLAVAETYRNQGLGGKLVAFLEAEAKELGIAQVFVLTYQAQFFSKCGFYAVAHSALPQKVWRDCIDCPKFPDCDEEALVKKIEEDAIS